MRGGGRGPRPDLLSHYESLVVEAQRELSVVQKAIDNNQNPAIDESLAKALKSKNDDLSQYQRWVSDSQRALNELQIEKATKREIDKWNNLSQNLNNSSTDRSISLKNILSPLRSKCCSSTGSSSGSFWRRKGGSMARLFCYGLLCEVLWYLPKFLTVLLAHVSR